VQLGEQLASSAQSTGTFEWRYDGWRALLADSGPEGPSQVLVGMPFGSGWERTLPSGHTIESHISPHNFYLETFLRTGAIGLLVMLALYHLALRALLVGRELSSGESQVLSPSVLFVVIAVQLLYYITYTPDTAQAMLFGLGCAAVLGVRRDRRASVNGAQDLTEPAEGVQVSGRSMLRQSGRR
jgi:hypothetical protein